MINRRLDIREDDAVKNFKNTALQQLQGVIIPLSLAFCQHICVKHFVRLFFKLGKTRPGADVVIPPLDGDRLIDERYQRFPNHASHPASYVFPYNYTMVLRNYNHFFK